MSTREALARAKPKVHELSIGTDIIYVRALSGAGRQAYLDLADIEQARTPSVARIAALGLCEQDGTLAYDASNAEDVAALEAVDGAVLNRIATKLFEISGLTADAVTNEEKKSEANRSD